MLTVYELLQKYKEPLSLELTAGSDGLKEKKIIVPEVERPGLALCGYLKHRSERRILVFGKIEIEYLKDISQDERKERLALLFGKKLPAIFVARRYRPPKELIEICNEKRIPLFRSSLSTMNLITRLTVILVEEFAPTMSCHGTLVEVFGIGLLIQGNSSVGKSEAALGLIERGHRLIADDVVLVSKKKGGYLEGTGPELTRHLLEIRGIGIINVAHLYGAVCISESKKIDLIVKLEQWDDTHFYDRIGLEEKFCELLNIKVPFYIMPVKPGRDVVLLLETIVLNHRLKETGYNSAKEFNVRLLDTLSKKACSKEISLDIL